jgi:acetolactate synthase-1/2/3 large subunit
MVTMRVVDYIAKFLEQRQIKHVFTLTGGGAMFINDGIACSKSITGIFNHHEQACAMAAVGYSKLHNTIAVVMPTTGCGGTNTITGVLDAWQDSNKVVFISGQANKNETTHLARVPLRKFGVQEANIVDIVKPITKYAIMITDAKQIRYELEKAFYLCEHGRPGPVWIDIPLDIQSQNIIPEELDSFTPYPDYTCVEESAYKTLYDALKNAKRPIIIAGNGIHLSNTRKEFIEFVEHFNIPVAFTYLGVDLLPSDHRLYVGRLGTKGDRAGNFAVQNSDLVLSLGSSLNVAVTGFRFDTFARDAFKIVVDIDENEHLKNTISINHKIITNLFDFFKVTRNKDIDTSNYTNWIKTCQKWRDQWPVCLPEYERTASEINIYTFLDHLSRNMKSDAIVVSDAGSAYYATSQAIKIRDQQRYITSGAQADMGFTIPCSIGVSIADNNREILGITGDGSFQLNIQELQTIVNYRLPIKLFVLNNGGYLSIRNTMDKFFDGRYIGTGPEAGLTFPQLKKIAFAYDIPYYRLDTTENLSDKIADILTRPGYLLCEVICPTKQDMAPSSSSKRNADGKLVSQPLENMFPFLSDEEFKREMIIKTI